jgi:hypothetical protein
LRTQKIVSRDAQMERWIVLCSRRTYLLLDLLLDILLDLLWYMQCHLATIRVEQKHSPLINAAIKRGQ